jgi:hypothetical protein
MIAALQLEGQKRLKEEASAPPASVEMTQPLISSTTLFERVQRLYSEGLEAGQLQHWAYDEDGISGKGNRDWHVETRKKTFEGFDSPIQKKIFIDNHPSDVQSYGNSIIGNIDGYTNDSLLSADSISSIGDMKGNVAAVNVTLSKSHKDLSTNHSITPKIDENDKLEPHSQLESNRPDQLLNGSNTNVSYAQLNMDLALPVCLDDTSDPVTSPSNLIENSVTASKSNFISMDSVDPSWSTLLTRRKLDLHGFPLAVAKAAIDYEFKKIYDDHCEHLIITEEMDKSSAVFSEGTDINSASTSTFSITDNNGHSSNRDMRSSRRNRMKNSGLRTDKRVGLTEPVVAKTIKRPNIVSVPSKERYERLGSLYDLYIVTGRGRHINNSGTRGVLRNELRDYIFHTYNIKTVSIDRNDGCIKVTRLSLIDWFQEMDR